MPDGFGSEMGMQWNGTYSIIGKPQQTPDWPRELENSTNQ